MTRTFEVTARVEIDRPAAAVWAVLADYDRDPEWRRGVSSMQPSPPGPAGVGTITVERMRFAGRTMRNDGEVVAVGPGLRLAWRTTAGVDAEGSRAVEELGPSRCRVLLETRVAPHGVERAYAALARVLLQRQLAGDARRLRALTMTAGSA